MSFIASVDSVSTFVAFAADAATRCDGRRLASLFSIRQGAFADSFFSDVKLSRPDDVCHSTFRDPQWATFAAHWLKAAASLARKTIFPAWKSMIDAFEAFFSIYDNATSNWPHPLLFVLTRECRLLCIRAMAEGKQAPAVHEQMERQLLMLQKYVQSVHRDRSEGPDSKLRGLLRIALERIRLTLRVRKLMECQTSIEMFASRGGSADDAKHGESSHTYRSYPMAEQVVYLYYRGRISCLRCQFTTAKDSLHTAFSRIPRDRFAKSWALTARFLIPVFVMFGYLPRQSTFPLAQIAPQYVDLLKALRECKAGDFQRAMDANLAQYMSDGVYLAVERLRIILYRQIMKRTYRVWQSMFPEKAQIALTVIHAGFVRHGEAMSVTEVEGIVATLIYEGYVRANVWHDRQMIVFPKQENAAFPKLSTLKLQKFQ